MFTITAIRCEVLSCERRLGVHLDASSENARRAI